MIVGTRGSELALAQAREVAEKLRALPGSPEVEVRTVRTAGDTAARKAIAEFDGKGIFVKAIDDLVLRGEIDLAVHSLKDIPTEPVDGLEVVAVLERRGGVDVLISQVGLEDLPLGARVGTSSTRRKAQLRRYRPDLLPVDIRGNVTTRVRRWKEGEFDALVLSQAGLLRLNLNVPSSVLDPGVFVPSPGQGVVAVTARAGGKASALAQTLDHAPTRRAAETEREVLRSLGGGCLIPIACQAQEGPQGLRVHLQILSADGSKCLEAHRTLPLHKSLVAARAFAEEALIKGGREILGVG